MSSRNEAQVVRCLDSGFAVEIHVRGVADARPVRESDGRRRLNGRLQPRRRGKGVVGVQVVVDQQRRDRVRRAVQQAGQIADETVDQRQVTDLQVITADAKNVLLCPLHLHVVGGLDRNAVESHGQVAVLGVGGNGGTDDVPGGVVDRQLRGQQADAGRLQFESGVTKG